MSGDTNNTLILDVTVERWRITQDRLGRVAGYRYGDPWPSTYPNDGAPNNCELALAREVAGLRISLLWICAHMIRQGCSTDICINCGGHRTDEQCRTEQKSCCPERLTLKNWTERNPLS